MTNFMTGIRSIFPDVVQVAKKFPISVAIATLLTCWLLMGVHEGQNIDNSIFALLSALFASIGATLYGLRKGLCTINNALLSLGACVFIGSFFLVPEQLYLTPYMVPVALLLLASTVAYIGVPLDNRSYWMFNHSFWFSFIVAVLGSLLIAGLIALLITSYSVLFDISVKSKSYQYSLIICLFLIAPLFWISMLPDDFSIKVKEGEPVEFTSKITALFVKYVFVPFFFLFALLFHGLAIKVLFAGQVPTGQVGWYGFALVSTGVATYLMAYPTRTVSGPLVSFFSSHWMWFLLVPLGLMAIAYQQRLAQYGLTPLRFFMAGFLLWAFGLIAYSLFRKRQKKPFDLRVIALGGALIIGLASFGPWGAQALSLNAQKQRLISMLEGIGAMDKGVIVKTLPHALEGATQTRQKQVIKDANGTLSYFKNNGRDKRLISLLSQKKREGLKINKKTGQQNILIAVREALQLPRYLTRTGIDRQRLQFNVNQPYNIPLDGPGSLKGRFFVNFDHNHKEQVLLRRSVGNANDKKTKIHIELKDQKLLVFEDKGLVGSFSYEALTKLAKADLQKFGQSYTRQILVVLSDEIGGGAKSRLYIHSLTYTTPRNFKVENSNERLTLNKQTRDKFSTDVEIKNIGFWFFKGK